MPEQSRSITDPTLAAELFGKLADTEPMNEEDFGHLFQQSLSSKANADKTKAFLNSNNVTQQERTAFYAYVNRTAKASLTNRVDTLANIGGVNVSPEDVLLVGGGMAAAAKGGATALRLAKGAMSGAAPIIKYETVKYGLHTIGVPMPLATIAAAGLAGYGGRGKVEPRAERTLQEAIEEAVAKGELRHAPTGTPPIVRDAGGRPIKPPIAAPAPTAPREAPPAAPMTPSAPVVAPVVEPVVPSAPAAPAKFNPATASSDVKQAFSAVKETPKLAELTNAIAFMRHGFSAEQAVAKVLAARPTPKLSAAEALAQKWGTPSDVDVAGVVAAKNARTTPAKGGTKR